MTPGEMSRWFTDLVKMRGYKDKYIDEREEQQILESAIGRGLDFDAARSALPRVCEDLGYALESEALVRIKDTLETFAGNDGQIDEKEFNDAVTIAKKSTLGKKSELECKRMVLQVMDANRYKVRTGWFSNWHSRAKSEVGLA